MQRTMGPAAKWLAICAGLALTQSGCYASSNQNAPQELASETLNLLPGQFEYHGVIFSLSEHNYGLLEKRFISWVDETGRVRKEIFNFPDDFFGEDVQERYRLQVSLNHNCNAQKLDGWNRFGKEVERVPSDQVDPVSLPSTPSQIGPTFVYKDYAFLGKPLIVQRILPHQGSSDSARQPLRFQSTTAIAPCVSINVFVSTTETEMAGLPQVYRRVEQALNLDQLQSAKPSETER